jgi:hypothetical protein
MKSQPFSKIIDNPFLFKSLALSHSFDAGSLFSEDQDFLTL